MIDQLVAELGLLGIRYLSRHTAFQATGVRPPEELLADLVQQPNVVSLYVTAFVIEKLINHKSVVDIFGSDADIYLCVHKQVAKLLP